MAGQVVVPLRPPIVNVLMCANCGAVVGVLPTPPIPNTQPDTFT